MKTISSVKLVEAGRRFSNVLRLASNVTDGETVTIGNEVYEIDTDPATVVSGNILVNCSGGVTPLLAGAALAAAITANTQQGIVAKALSANEILIATKIGAAGRALACSETLAGANNSWAAAVMYGGSDTFKGLQLQARAANATEVALGVMRFAFPFNPVSAIVQVRTSAGVPKAWGGLTNFAGDRIDLANTGSTDWAVSDIATVFAGE